MTAGTIEHEHLAEHAHDPGRSQQAGVLMLIVADAVFVLSLVFTYFYLRGLNTDGGWIPSGSKTLSVGDGWLIAGPLVLSAIAYRWAELRGRAGNQGQLMAGSAVALLLVLADLALQIWKMTTMPFGVGSGSYASTVITMAGANVFHLVLTALLGVAIWNRTRRGLFTGGSGWHVRVVGYWWYWVALSSVIVASTTSFIASPHA